MEVQSTKPAPFKVNERGVWHRYKPGRVRLIAPYIEKRAYLVRLADRTWHVEFTFVDENGCVQTAVLTKPDSKKPSKLREAMESGGYDWPEIKSNNEALLLEFLKTKPTRRLDWVAKTGWVDEETFVFPDKAIGANAENVKFRPLDSMWQPKGTKGSAKTWARVFLRNAIHSPIAMLMCGTAFGGPFHQLLEIEGGGFNTFGPPGKGKTSAAAFAQSIYSVSGRDNLDTWDTTPTRIDELRCENADMLVYLDEVGRSGSTDSERIQNVSDAVFRLTTGRPRGRSKAFKVDPNHPPARLALLSTSVRSLFEISSASKSHVFGGEEVRLIDVPAVVSEELGIFDTCPPECTSTREAAFTLESTASNNFGVVGRKYIRKILEDRDAAVRFVRERVDHFINLQGAPKDSEYRYVQRFALAFAGLELARKLGVVEIPQGVALKAIKTCYDRARASAPNFSKMLDDAMSALASNLSNQVSVIDLSQPERKTTTEKFAAASGVILAHDDGRTFYGVKLDRLGKLSSSTLSSKHILDELKARRAVRQIEGGKSSIPTTIPGLGKGKRQRLVWIWKDRLNALKPPTQD